MTEPEPTGDPADPSGQRRRRSSDGAPRIAGESRFPDPRRSGRDGLVAVGGSLAVSWLLDAYRHGVFPWPTSDREPLWWFSPAERGVIPLDGLHVSRRLRRRLRRGEFRVSSDADFAAVIAACATGPGRVDGTWITPRMRRAYERLHAAGHAHSVEVYAADEAGDGRLVGGAYGVAIGGLFAAESMFHRQTDASKAALAWLVAHLARRGYRLLDVQQVNDHTATLGAVAVPRDEYLARLREAIDLPVTFGNINDEPLSW